MTTTRPGNTITITVKAGGDMTVDPGVKFLSKGDVLEWKSDPPGSLTISFSEHSPVQRDSSSPAKLTHLDGGRLQFRTSGEPIKVQVTGEPGVYRYCVAATSRDHRDIIYLDSGCPELVIK